MSFCPKCGTELVEGTKYCSKCGIVVDSITMRSEKGPLGKTIQPYVSKTAKTEKSGKKIGLSFDFELNEGENVLLESPTIIDIEFNKQQDFFQTILGEMTQGRVIAKPYLTNKRILMWLFLVPFEIREPKSIWYTLPFENISYMRPGKGGPKGKGRKGLEIEFESKKVGGIASSVGKRLSEQSGISEWIGKRIGKERTKIWMYLPDFPMWNMSITKILEDKNLL